MTINEPALLVHKACNSQLIGNRDGPLFCEVCGSEVRPDETAEADNTPGPFSGLAQSRP